MGPNSSTELDGESLSARWKSAANTKPTGDAGAFSSVDVTGCEATMSLSFATSRANAARASIRPGSDRVGANRRTDWPDLNVLPV